MKPRLLFAVVLLSLICYQSAGAWVNPALADDKTYTNDDLGDYKGGNGGTVIGDRPLKQGYEKRSMPDDKNEKSQRYWCSKGSASRAKIDKSKSKVDDAEERLSILESEKPDGKKSKDHKKKLAAAKKKLKSAQSELSQSERSLDELEQRAHMQNIPPGWLRCQFHY